MNYLHPEKLITTYNRLAGKVIFITGATSGIGEAAARLFAAEGALVACAARRMNRLATLVEELQEAGHEAVGVECDVTEEASIEAAIATTVAQFGRLDGAFNNAGRGGVRGAVDALDANAFDSVIAVNLRGVFLCMKHEARVMLRQETGGSIVNTSSVGGLIGAPGNSAYAASKFALSGLTKCAALDYARSGVRVNAIAPGATRSEMFDRWVETDQAREAMAARSPMNGIAHPDDMARLALFLLSDEARWTTGAIVPGDHGSSAGEF